FCNCLLFIQGFYCEVSLEFCCAYSSCSFHCHRFYFSNFTDGLVLWQYYRYWGVNVFYDG
ncbi:MAG: hypothetical protein SGI87_08190, partial [Flavobacteriales bacterium]|nr:hypothetical protein [Flavobacteriales bacterium]